MATTREAADAADAEATRLRVLLEEVHGLLAKTQKSFRSRDVARARELVELILDRLR